MRTLGIVALLVLGSASVAMAVAAVYRGRIWCVPHAGFEWRGRWVRRSREAPAFWSNTLTIGAVGLACVVAGCRALVRPG